MQKMKVSDPHSPPESLAVRCDEMNSPSDKAKEVLSNLGEYPQEKA